MKIFEFEPSLNVSREWNCSVEPAWYEHGTLKNSTKRCKLNLKLNLKSKII